MCCDMRIDSLPLSRVGHVLLRVTVCRTTWIAGAQNLSWGVLIVVRDSIQMIFCIVAVAKVARSSGVGVTNTMSGIFSAGLLYLVMVSPLFFINFINFSTTTTATLRRRNSACDYTCSMPPSTPPTELPRKSPFTPLNASFAAGGGFDMHVQYFSLS